MTTAQVVWINGAFGVGKTTVARAVQAHLKGSVLFDPEQVGFLLRSLLPADLQLTLDFQDIPLWRQLTRTTIEGLVKEYKQPVIVPMTLVHASYFDEIVGELRRTGINVQHVALMASACTLRRRIWKQCWMPGLRWRLKQIERCLKALQDPLFATHIDTDQRSCAHVVEMVLSHLVTMGL